MTFKIYSGADVTVVPYKFFQSIRPPIPLLQTRMILRGPCNREVAKRLSIINRIEYIVQWFGKDEKSKICHQANRECHTLCHQRTKTASHASPPENCARTTAYGTRVARFYE